MTSVERRILILTSDAGLGHRAAAEALESALRHAYGERSQIDVVNPLEDERVPAVLREVQSDYDEIVKQIPDLYKLGYQVSDAQLPVTVLETALTVLLFGVLHDLVEQYRPHVIVATYPAYQAPLRALNAVHEKAVPLMTVVTDLVTVHQIWFNTGVNICVVPTEQAQQLALESGMEACQVPVIGIPVDPQIAAEERESRAIRRDLGWHPDLMTVLAVGSKRVSGLLDIVRGLNYTDLPLQLILVAGGDDALYEQFQEIEWHLPAQVYNFVDNLPAMMHASNAILCKAGGLIVTEALACGLPLLLADVLPGQETGNAQYVIEGGGGVMAGDLLTALAEVHEWVHDKAVLAERTRCARALGRPQAAQEIADLAWTLAGQAKQVDAAERERMMELLEQHGIAC